MLLIGWDYATEISRISDGVGVSEVALYADNMEYVAEDPTNVAAAMQRTSTWAEWFHFEVSSCKSICDPRIYPKTTPAGVQGRKTNEK